MSTILYGLKAAIRRPRLLVGIILGIMLGISLLTTAFMTIDYLGYASIRKELSSVKVDMRAHIWRPDEGALSNLNNTIDSIESVDGVNICEPVFYMELWGANISSNRGLSVSYNYFNYAPRIYGFLSKPKLGGLEVINGTLELRDNEIALGYLLANMLDVDVGDNITLTYSYYEEGSWVYKNITFMVKGIVEVRGKLWDAVIASYSSLIGEISSPEESWRDPNLALIGGLNYVYGLLNEFNSSTGEIPLGYALELNIFLDRDKIINPWNLDASINKLNEIGDEVNIILQSRISGVSYSVENYLGLELMFYSLSLMVARINITFQLIPVIILGGILALIAIWLSVNERRREVGLLRIKGAKSSQVTAMLFTEAISGGLVGGSIGGLLGYVTALILIKVQWIDLAKQYLPEAILNNFVYSYLVAGLIIGGILGILAVFIPARKVSRLSLLEAIQEYSEELEATEKLGKMVWISLIIGTYSLPELALGLPVLRYVTKLGMHGGMYFMIFIGIIFFPIELFSIYVGPFLFAYAASKFIGFYAYKLRKVFSALTKLFSRELNYVAVRNFIRKKVRVSRVIFLIALTLSFTVYYGIASATNENRLRINTEMSVGSDIQVKFYSGLTYGELANFTRNISSIDGVKDVCRVVSIPLSSRLIWRGTEVLVETVGIDGNYFNVTFMKESYLEDVSTKDAVSKLSSGNAILSINFKLYFGKTKGGTIILRNEMTDKEYSLTIAGFIKFAPGISSYIFELQSDYSPMVFVNIDAIIKLMNSTSGIYGKALLIDVKDGYNVSAIVSEINKRISDAGLYAKATSFGEELEKRLSFGLQNLSFFFVNIEFYVALIIALIGMMLVMSMAIYERKREFALLVTRGAAFTQILGTLIGEAFLIVFLGFGLGILAAIVYSYGFLIAIPQLTTIGQLPYELPPGYSIIIPEYLVYSLFIGFFVFIFASIIPLILLSRKPVSEELRIHH